MISIQDIYEYYKMRYFQNLRDELAADLEDFLAEPPPKTLKDYLPKGQMVLHSGYTTHPDSTTAIDELDIKAS